MNSKLDLIKTCEDIAKNKFKFKDGKSTYQIFDYDFYLGFLYHKISGKQEGTCANISMQTVLRMFEDNKLFL